MKARAGTVYRYVPNLLDSMHRCARASPGQLVRVVKLRFAPPPNTMGQCHIEDMAGHFLGMVSCNSLYHVTDRSAAVLAISMPEAA